MVEQMLAGALGGGTAASGVDGAAAVQAVSERLAEAARLLSTLPSTSLGESTHSSVDKAANGYQ